MLLCHEKKSIILILNPAPSAVGLVGVNFSGFGCLLNNLAHIFPESLVYLSKH